MTTAEVEKKTWPTEFVQKIQRILDRTAENANPVTARTFSAPQNRLSAEQFLETWNAVRFCVVGSASKDGRPHLAAIHAQFQPDGRLTMRMMDGSVRQKDFEENPRVALNKYTSDGAVMTIYGRPKVVEGSLGTGRAPGGPQSWEVEIEIDRIYAMQPAPRT